MLSFTTGNQHKGGLNYTIMRSYFLVGMDQLGKPFWERKTTRENQAREDVHRNAFVEGWCYLITQMTSALYTKESIWTWYRDEGNDGKQIWEFMTVSDIAYTIFVLENHGEVWKQDWKLHEDNPYTSNVEKESTASARK